MNLEQVFGQNKRIKYLVDPELFLKISESEFNTIKNRITLFLKEMLDNSGCQGYVIGLSGGIDSSLTATLAVEAVGRENVIGYLLPSKFTSKSSNADARLTAETLGISCVTVDKNLFEHEIEIDNKIEEQVEKDLNTSLTVKGKYKMRLGNDHARTRMKILRRQAHKRNLLVLGTTNLTETLLGYATVAGDGYKGIDVEPLQQLLKTTERYFAEYLGVPKSIVWKTSTAELWEDQTDESELAMSYESMDRIIVGTKLGLSPDEIITANKHKEITKDSINKLYALINRNAFKNRAEPYANLEGVLRYL